MTLTGSVALALLRAGQVAALLVLVGSFAFAAVVLGRTSAPEIRRTLRRMEILAAALALGCGAVWFLAETARLGDATDLGQVIAAVPAMLAYLGFARWLLARLGLLVLILAGLAVGSAEGSRSWRFAVLFALADAALGVQPWLGHAGAAGGLAGQVLPGAELIHLAGAALWLGGLPALLVVLHRAQDAETRQALRRFSAISLGAVGAIAVGGVVQGWLLVGGVARLSGTGYGQAVLLKTALFAAALALAGVNRLVLTRRMEGAGAVAAHAMATCARLRGSVAIEAGLGLAIVLTAGWLSGLPPGADQIATARFWPWLPGGLIVVLAIAGALWFARPVTPSRVQATGVAHDRPPAC
ncbi:MAG: CopD family protein [Acetobacteraceae bacterium]